HGRPSRVLTDVHGPRGPWALLAWAYDNREDTPLDVAAMVASPHGWFMADMLSPGELGAAVEHLRGLGLVTGDPHALALTEERIAALEPHGGGAAHQRPR